jgi:hypothetical protein
VSVAHEVDVLKNSNKDCYLLVYSAFDEDFDSNRRTKEESNQKASIEEVGSDAEESGEDPNKDSPNENIPAPTRNSKRKAKDLPNFGRRKFRRRRNH